MDSDVINFRLRGLTLLGKEREREREREGGGERGGGQGQREGERVGEREVKEVGRGRQRQTESSSMRQGQCAFKTKLKKKRKKKNKSETEGRIRDRMSRHLSENNQPKTFCTNLWREDQSDHRVVWCFCAQIHGVDSRFSCSIALLGMFLRVAIQLPHIMSH